jgi:hypothetical protein
MQSTQLLMQLLRLLLHQMLPFLLLPFDKKQLFGLL